MVDVVGMFLALRIIAIVVGVITVVMVSLGLATNAELGPADVIFGLVLGVSALLPGRAIAATGMLTGFAGVTAIFVVSVTISVMTREFNPETTFAVVICAICTAILWQWVRARIKED